jgi:hypothetical protein
MLSPEWPRGVRGSAHLDVRNTHDAAPPLTTTRLVAAVIAEVDVLTPAARSPHCHRPGRRCARCEREQVAVPPPPLAVARPVAAAGPGRRRDGHQCNACVRDLDQVAAGAAPASASSSPLPRPGPPPPRSPSAPYPLASQAAATAAERHHDACMRDFDPIDAGDASPTQ